VSYITEQENFWQGEFGSEYVERSCRGDYERIALWSRILSRTSKIDAVLELGANRGLNLIAINQLMPKVQLSAVEINKKAANELRSVFPNIDLHISSIFDYKPSDSSCDMVITSGVLIHINPAQLPHVYELMYNATSRYILIAEYYNPTPIEVDYRGNKGFLFKRDYAGEMLDMYSDLSLVDYGFVYHRDPRFPLNDINWFMLKKD
jgi:pseudaminic acid biosynthesis-associated methylase